MRTSPDPEQGCGIALVTVSGKSSRMLADQLCDRYQIIVTPIVHTDFEGLRITPNVYTTVGGVHAFVEVMTKLLAS